MHSIDFQPRCGVVDTNDGPQIADRETLARYWNDDLPDAVNLATISWWLSQPGAADNFPTDSGASR